MKNKDIFAIRDGKITVDELLAKYPVKEIVSDLMEIIKNSKEMAELTAPTKQPKILVTQEQFQEFFRIKGLTADGQVSHRGRKPKKAEN